MDTKYNIIASHIRNEIEAGRLKPGSRLPSIREVCKSFGCSSTTALRAYNCLEAEHRIYAKPKSGYFAMDIEKKASNSPNDLCNFSVVWPDIETLPYKDIQHCLNQAVETYGGDLFSTSVSQGLLSLRKTMAKHLTNYQIFTSNDNIFITSGSQQALYLLANMPFPNGKRNILVEQPTYLGMLKILEINGINVSGIERTACGIDFNELERIFRSGSIKFFYTMPRFHNPTGFSYTKDQKMHILKLAEKYDIYLVEDDYLADLETDGKSDPLFAYDTSSRVIYVRSFSKTLLPGLRIGVVALPDLLKNNFFIFKRFSDLSSSVFSQGALEIYLRSGMYESHKKRIREFYSDRLKLLKAECKAKLPGSIKCSIPDAGFFSYLELPEACSADRVIDALAAKNVRVFNTATSFLPEFRRHNTLSLTICRAGNEKIEEGTRVIAATLEQLTGVRGGAV